MTVFSLGEAFVEFVKKEGGKLEKPGTFYGPYPSGAPAITASAISRMGGKSRYAAVVGNDAFGRAFTERLRSDGVDVSSIRTTEKRTTGMAFVSYEGASRSFLFHAKDSATALLSEKDVNLSGVSIVHISGSSLGMGWQVARAVRRTVSTAKRQGIPISFDPNVRKELLNEKMKRTLIAISKTASYLMLSNEDAASLFGDPEAACRELSRDRVVILKKGAMGSEIYHKEERKTVPAIRVHEEDPTGAGDWYNGAFLAMIEQGESVESAAKLASAAAAISVSKIGPMEGPYSRSEVLELLKTSGLA